MSYLRQLGALRLGLLGLAIVVLVLRPESGAKVSYEGWRMVPTLLVPTLAPLVFLGLLLDALMTRVLMSDVWGVERRRLRRAVTTDLVVALLVGLVWVPFFLALGG
ncbi:MAG: hypothetical protein GWO16_14150 [Gammaproteobacteria bacterium]|nr:hypothetical protein [Gammaproteobacteria bacterium]NIR99071.1 hypothetical protein [Gammaproteobacteria bacterium]NIT64703.1 hypothetical protein [Gammaproteobacteria bacterium]NIV21661.1 hypothetical protein [Gammaproteobacteria bacterium]NIX10623.1 hypothetical protein [Gammaproteobacteria bacterium]